MSDNESELTRFRHGEPVGDELTLDAAVERIGELVRDVDKLNTNWKNELSRRVNAEAERDRLAMQLEAAQAALTETMQENTAHAEEAEAGRAVLRRVFEMVSALEHPSDILDVLDAALHPEPPHA